MKVWFINPPLISSIKARQRNPAIRPVIRSLFHNSPLRLCYLDDVSEPSGCSVMITEAADGRRTPRDSAALAGHWLPDSHAK